MMESIDKLRKSADEIANLATPYEISPDYASVRRRLGELAAAIEREHAELMHEATCKAHADGERSAIKQVRSASEDYRRGYDAAMAETSEMRGFCERLEGAAKEREEIEVFGVAYMPLPVDADGVPIRVGDVLVDHKTPRTVAAISEDGVCLSGYEGGSYYRMSIAVNHRHHHEPTEEDVLWEFAEKIIDSQIPTVRPTYDEAIAEYAARLRLAGDAE